jgi:hypothetical protein
MLAQTLYIPRECVTVALTLYFPRECVTVALAPWPSLSKLNNFLVGFLTTQTSNLSSIFLIWYFIDGLYASIFFLKTVKVSN